MKWQMGRQGTGYKKKLLFQMNGLIKMDAYLLRFDPGAGVPMHTDQVEAGRHYRMNITLVKPAFGGLFYCFERLFSWWRIVVFRPDIEPHSLSEPLSGPLYMLSIGWVLGADRGLW